MGMKFTGNPRDLDTNHGSMIFRKMLDGLGGWESTWNAPLENSTAVIQAYPRTVRLQQMSIFYFFLSHMGTEEQSDSLGQQGW